MSERQTDDRSRVAVRSLLAVPASNLKMVEKGLVSRADTVVPDKKADARKDIVHTLKELRSRARSLAF